MLLQILFSTGVAVVTAAGINGLDSLDNLIVFGDSYTDQGRLPWFVENDGEAPPPGTLILPSNSTSTGGYIWPYFVSQTLNATAYNYAVSGATCSNELIERDFPEIGQPYPSVTEYEVPAFLSDAAWRNESTGTNTLFEDAEGRPTRLPENTVYALWIGTNDLGANAFLTDSARIPGATVARDFTDCVWGVFDTLYGAGGRHFVLFNMVPLDQAPLYNSPVNNVERNQTLVESRMREAAATVNTVFDYGVPFHMRLRGRWPNATFTLFDVHRIIEDIIANPSAYLDSPADVSGWYTQYAAGESMDGCAPEDVEAPPLSGFLWHDALHPSERADEIIAAEFAKMVQWNSIYATYY